MKSTHTIVQDRDTKFTQVFTELAWSKIDVDVFGHPIGYVPRFHLEYKDFFKHLRSTMNFYTFKFLYREHDDHIEVGWISHHLGIYKQCRTKKHSTQFLKAGTASAINALREMKKKEKDESAPVSTK